MCLLQVHQLLDLLNTRRVNVLVRFLSRYKHTSEQDIEIVHGGWNASSNFESGTRDFTVVQDVAIIY